MASMTYVFGRLGCRSLQSSLRSQIPDVSYFSCQSQRSWSHYVFTPCQNCGQTPSIFRRNRQFRGQIRHFIRRSEKGQPLEARSKISVGPRQNEGPGSLVRPFLFTSVVCVGSFSGAMIWQYETMRSHAQKMMRHGFQHKDTTINLRKFGFRQHISSMWQNLSAGERMVCGIIGVNLLVFLMWRIPALSPIMTTYFCATPTSSAPCLSMLLSTFSHINLLHLAANMYVLWSFSSVALGLLGKEQFMAVYLSAGTVSSFTSYALKVARKSFTPSLGASGALMAVLGAVCMSFPDARLAVAFIGDIIPHSFSADSAMKALITFDTAGLIMGWKLFDHAAHLGGIMFGILYMKFGRDYIWGNREKLMEIWHKFRGQP